VSSPKPGISRVVIAVDVMNVLHRGWDGKPLSYDHLKGALRSLEAWLMRRGLTADLRLVSDSHLLSKAHPQHVSKFGAWIKTGKIRLAPPGQEADLVVLEVAKEKNGIVVSADRYTEWYCRGHEWLLFQSGRSLVPAKDPRGPWAWKWADYRRKRRLYYGWPDPDSGRGMDLAYLREVEEVTGFDFQDSRWPSDGEPVGFHHMARAMDQDVADVRRRASRLGIPDSLPTFLTDAQVRRIWSSFDPGGRMPIPWRNAA